MISQTERVRRASRRRRDLQKQELRQAILAAAGELILETGYAGLSLRRVAERIGYSATTIYLYYENKDDLVAAVVEEGFARFLRALQAVREDDPAARPGELGRAYVRFALANRVYYRLMFMQRADLLRRPLRHDEDHASFDVLREAVQRGIDAGVLRPGDARAYGLALWATVHGVVSLAIGGAAGLDDRETEAAAEVALDMCRRGLAAGGATDSGASPAPTSGEGACPRTRT